MATYLIDPAGIYPEYEDLPALNSGDIVQVTRGYQYKEFAIDALSGVTFVAVGAGPNPIFGSLKTATGWTFIGGGLWELTDSSLGEFLNVLVVDGVPRGKGISTASYDDYHIISSDSATGSLNHGALPFTATGEVTIRLQSFITNLHTVTADAGGVISFSEGSIIYSPKAGYGFFLQNQLECLTEVGDWMYDAATKKITIYLGSDVPADYLIQYPTSEYALLIEDSDNLLFSGINFSGANGDGLKIRNSHHIGFSVCNTRNCGGMGIRLDDAFCDDFTFTDCRVDHAFAGGFYATFGCDRIHVINCQAYNIGMIPGGSRYMNGDGRSNGFTLEGGVDNMLDNCRAEYTGFNAFTYGGNGMVVRDCFGKFFGFRKADCACFYIYGGFPSPDITSPITLEGNMAMYGVGNVFGTLDIINNCQGFYFDNGTNGIVSNNPAKPNLSAFNPTGLYGHDMRDCLLKNFVLYGNTRQLHLKCNAGMDFTGNTYADNWHITLSLNQEMASTFGTAEEIAAFGTFQNNRYSNFYTGKGVFSTNDGSEPKPYKFEINPSAYFEMLGETGYLLEQYDEIQYTVDSVLGSINYKTTDPSDFGLITGNFSNFSAVRDSAGMAISKILSGKTGAFLRLGPVESDTWYLVSGSGFGDRDQMQNDLELNYTAPGNPIKNSKIDSDSFALPLKSLNDRLTDQFYLLMEKDFSSYTIEDLSFARINVSREVSLSAIEIDEENKTWEIALDGIFPGPDPEPEPVVNIQVNMKILIV